MGNLNIIPSNRSTGTSTRSNRLYNRSLSTRGPVLPGISGKNSTLCYSIPWLQENQNRIRSRWSQIGIMIDVNAFASVPNMRLFCRLSPLCLIGTTRQRLDAERFAWFFQVFRRSQMSSSVFSSLWWCFQVRKKNASSENIDKLQQTIYAQKLASKTR